MPARKTPGSDWVIKILRLRIRLGLNQSELADRLNYSAMALSRWESGTHEPTSRAYLQMGNLAQGKESTWFWTRAGMNTADLARMFPEGAQEKADFPDFEIVVTGVGKKRKASRIKTRLVALPVLTVHVGTRGAPGDQVLDLDQAEVSETIAAPARWCPNPKTTSCLPVRGSAMSPLIHDSDIVVLDYSQHDTTNLNGQIIVTWNRTVGPNAIPFCDGGRRAASRIGKPRLQADFDGSRPKLADHRQGLVVDSQAAVIRPSRRWKR